MTLNIRVGVMPRQLNPRAHTTPLALRRICGVCRHFAGEGLAAPGHCARFGADVSGRASAERCDEWGRRTAGVDAPVEVRPVRPAAPAALPEACSPAPSVSEAEVPADAAKRGPKASADIERRRATVRGLASEGKTLREAAAILGVSYETVRGDAKAGSIRFPRTSEKLRRPRQAQKNPELRAELVARISAGGVVGSVRELAARYKVKVGTIHAMASRIRRQVQG
jgi:transposase